MAAFTVAAVWAVFPLHPNPVVAVMLPLETKVAAVTVFVNV
jgi:hypothetical protein